MYTIEDFIADRSLYVLCHTVREIELLKDCLSQVLLEDQMGALLGTLQGAKELLRESGAAYRFNGRSISWNPESSLEGWRRCVRDGTYTKEVSVWELLGIQNNRFSEEEFMKMLEV